MTEDTCEICEYGRAHACWPPEHKGTHCGDCHRSWTGTREAHCVVCHAHFTGDSVADLHWVKGKGHQAPETVEGLYLGPDAKWSTEPDRDPVALGERLAAARAAHR